MEDNNNNNNQGESNALSQFPAASSAPPEVIGKEATSGFKMSAMSTIVYFSSSAVPVNNNEVVRPRNLPPDGTTFSQVCLPLFLISGQLC